MAKGFHCPTMRAHSPSYNEVSKAAERLKTKGLIRYRKRGSSKKFVSYYYLSKLRSFFDGKQKKMTKQDETEEVNIKKYKSNLF